MKKKRYIIFGSVVAIALLFVLFIYIFLKQFTICIISPDICKQLSPNTPEQFVMVEGKYSAFEGNYLFATVLKNGNLLVIVSDEQKKNIIEDSEESLQKNWSAYITDDVQISDNYSKVTTKCYLEQANDRVIYSILMVEGCLYHQILDGKKPDEISVQYEIYDSKTEELKFSSDYPKESMGFSVAELGLSSIYD